MIAGFKTAVNEKARLGENVALLHFAVVADQSRWLMADG